MMCVEAIHRKPKSFDMVKIEPRLQQRSWPRKLGVVWKTGNRDERFRGSNPLTSA